ncbi:MAG: hypothetical protein EXR39_00820 [Betaproteobacteria bacterium]|nr:hypothetical protein [Betaproteobacteria bacterium]
MKYALIALALLSTAAVATPRVKSAEECVAFADLALVASTLAKHGITKDHATAMLPDMHNLASDDAPAIAQDIVNAAYRPGHSEPKDFANKLGAQCMRTGGQLDGMLGESL